MLISIIKTFIQLNYQNNEFKKALETQFKFISIVKVMAKSNSWCIQMTKIVVFKSNLDHLCVYIHCLSEKV